MVASPPVTSPLLTGSLQNSSLAPIVPPSVGKVAGGERGEEGKVEGREWEGKVKGGEREGKGGRGEEGEGREGKGGREREEGGEGDRVKTSRGEGRREGDGMEAGGRGEQEVRGREGEGEGGEEREERRGSGKLPFPPLFTLTLYHTQVCTNTAANFRIVLTHAHTPSNKITTPTSPPFLTCGRNSPSSLVFRPQVSPTLLQEEVRRSSLAVISSDMLGLTCSTAQQ